MWPVNATSVDLLSCSCPSLEFLDLEHPIALLCPPPNECCVIHRMGQFQFTYYGSNELVDGSFTEAWTSWSSCSSSDWLRITLTGRPEDTVVFTRSVKIHFQPGKLWGLIGAQVRVGNEENVINSDGTAQNRLCAVVESTSEVLHVADDHAYIELECVAANVQFIWLVQSETKCMEGILEFEVKGRRHACTECATGTYEDQAGSTACKSCPWAWSQNMLARTVSAKASTSKDDCQCNKGLTGLAGGLYQDVQDYRPTYVGGNVTGASVFFSRNNSQFLHGPLITSGSTDNIYNRPNDVNLHEPREFRVSSNGGLTIVITVKFMGEIQFGERLVDLAMPKVLLLTI